MKILKKEGIRALYKDKTLKKLVLRFAKILHKKYPYLELYIDYIDEILDETTEQPEKINLPVFIIGFPADFIIKDSEKFMGDIGKLFEESGNLQNVHQLFLLELESIDSIEKRTVD